MNAYNTFYMNMIYWWLYQICESDSTNVLTELENIDDEADVFKIRFVRIHDLELAEDYSLYYMPSLVYFRSGMPIVYEGK